MIKVFCHPITKLLLFLGGFASGIFVLRAANLTFDRAIAFAFNTDTLIARPLYEGVFFGRGFVLFALAFLLCGGLLLTSVWKTKLKPDRPKFLALWRNLDFALMIILVGLVALFSLYGLRVFYAQFHAVFRVQIYEVLGLPFLTYTVGVFAATELIARIRDKDLMRTLYWLRFFRLYPPWKPLGLLMSLLLIGSLVVLLVTTQEIIHQLTVDYSWVSFTEHVPADWFDLEWYEPRRVETVLTRTYTLPPIVSVELLLPFSLLSLIATTYFVTFALNLSNKYAEASASQIRAEQFKSELITNVSHDIRTPLTSVINYVDLLKSQPLEGAAAEYVSVLGRKSDRLKMLIDDLIDASKASTGNEEVSMQTVNLNEIVGQIAGEFEDDFLAADLSLVLTEPDEPLLIYADNRHLWRVLENLFSNVSKYSLPGTRVFAEIALSNIGCPTFTLKNTSKAPLDLSGDTLTEQFIRGDRARQSEGSGLGLYIAKNLVELMDGSFHIHITGDLFVLEIAFCKNKGDETQ